MLEPFLDWVKGIEALQKGGGLKDADPSIFVS
jgi:hypothetical protein